MQLCRKIYYSVVPWLLNMFRAILSLETCWAVKEQWNNKVSYTVTSCWSFLWDLYYDARVHERQVWAFLISLAMVSHTRRMEICISFLPVFLLSFFSFAPSVFLAWCLFYFRLYNHITIIHFWIPPWNISISFLIRNLFRNVKFSCHIPSASWFYKRLFECEFELWRCSFKALYT